jgi:hypothetical protein
VADESDPEGDVAEKGLLLAFDMDCGEVVPGRHLHLRGLRDDGHWPDRLGNRLPDEVQGSCQMTSLDWEIVPAVSEGDHDAAKWYQHDVAEVQYSLDPPLSWDLRTASGVGGCSVDATPGEPSSRGTYGPYPLPAGVRQVSFTVIPYLDRRPADHSDGEGTGSVIKGSRHPVVQVVVDLPSRSARWEPAVGAD